MFNKKWVSSPFFTSRGNYPLDMIIIHHIGSSNEKLYSIGGTITWFTNINVHKNKETGIIENKVSAHYAIPREQHKGNDLYNFVKDINIAYHAGISQWTINDKLRKYINRYSIGIELEGDGNLVEYTDYQYDVLYWLVKDLINQYNIPESNIVGHEDIAPGRKVDPGKFFDWKKFRIMLNPPVIIEGVKIPSAYPALQSSPEDLPQEDNFFMGDGSKTHGTFVILFEWILKVLYSFFKK